MVCCGLGLGPLGAASPSRAAAARGCATSFAATAPQRRQRGLRSAQFPTARGRARDCRRAPRTSSTSSGGGRKKMWGQPAGRGAKPVSAGSRGQAAASLPHFDSFFTHKGRAAAIRTPVPTPVPMSSQLEALQAENLRLKAENARLQAALQAQSTDQDLLRTLGRSPERGRSLIQHNRPAELKSRERARKTSTKKTIRRTSSPSSSRRGCATASSPAKNSNRATYLMISYKTYQLRN